MSSATANSAARKRRAGKQLETSKAGPSGATQQNSNIESIKPVLTTHDAILYLSNRMVKLENIVNNLMTNKNESELILGKIDSLEKKINDTIISGNVKTNLLETDVMSLKDNLNKVSERNLDMNNFFEKMQSLVVYDEVDEADEDNKISIIQDNSSKENITMSDDIIAELNE